MTRNDTGLVPDHIVLRSDLVEMSRLFAWVDALASRYEIAKSTWFAINLCLEEAVSNVIRHGYANQASGSVAVHFVPCRDGNFVFTVEDEGPPFNPLAAPTLPLYEQENEPRIGGHGIRLLSGFADSLEYEPTATGNRLHIRFSKGISPAPGKKAE